MKYAILLLLLISCTVTKDRKAISRVLANPKLSDSVYAVLVREHPISADTVFRLLPGKEIVQVDCLEADSLIHDTTTFTTTIEKPILRRIERTVTKTDTLLRTIIDNRTLQAADRQVIVLQANLQNSQNDAARLKKAKLYWILAFSGLGLLFLIFLILALRSEK